MLDVFGNSGIVGNEVQPALLVIFVLFDNGPTTLVASIGVIVVHPNIVSAHGAVVVGVRLVIGDGVEFPENISPARIENASE